mmetsp:Transcript_72996/g.227488  ORF Transcript_72996/g.227488 Transcript_72996/m.227488 type:complete len:262 (+) Transcript_72996:405-1190(+)
MLSDCSDSSSSTFSIFTSRRCNCSEVALLRPLAADPGASSKSWSARAARWALAQARSSSRFFSRVRFARRLHFCSAFWTNCSCFSVSVNRRTFSKSSEPAASMSFWASSLSPSCACSSTASSAMPQVTSCSRCLSRCSSSCRACMVFCACIAMALAIASLCASFWSRWRFASLRFWRSSSMAFSSSAFSLAARSRNSARSTSPSSSMASSGPQSTAMQTAPAAPCGASAQKRSCAPTCTGSKRRGSTRRPFSRVPCELPRS